MLFIKSALTLILSIFLVACGGSSGSESFFASISGVYYTENGLLRINSDGNYVAVNTLNPDGAIGLETGRFTQDSSDQIIVTIFKDLQENCAGDIEKATGFSFNDTSPKFSKKNGELYLNDEKLTRLEVNGIIGGWVIAEVKSTNEADSHKSINASVDVNAEQFYLLPGNKFILLDPDNDDPYSDERNFGAGTFNHSEATKELSLNFDHEITGISDNLCQKQLQRDIRHGEDEVIAFYNVELSKDTLTVSGDHEDADNRVITETLFLEKVKTRL